MDSALPSPRVITSPTYSACPKGLAEISVKKTVNFWLGGIFCTSTITVSKSLVCGLPCKTVTRPVAPGKSGLMLVGKSGNWIIKVGEADASTLTVGATCPGVPNAGVRNAGPVVGKLIVPPLVVLFVVGGFDGDGPEQALNRRVSRVIPRSMSIAG